MKKIIFLIFLITTINGFSQNYEVCENSPSSKNWTIIWGGKPSSAYGAIFMEKQAGDSFYNQNVIYADYQFTIDLCKSVISKFRKDYKIVSVYGFSRGGINAWEQIGKVEFVGLIDPLIPKNYNTNFDITKVFMLYNTDVWNRENKERLESVSSYLGKNSKRLYIPHLEIPKLFFNKYRR
jgi:hypothetical protein